MSPKQNREIPPLDYGRVHRLKREFPELRIVINGGLVTLEDSVAQLDARRWRHDRPRGVPGLVAARSTRCAACTGGMPATEHEVLGAFERYVAREVESGTPLRAMTRHLLGMRSGRAGGRRWRRRLGELNDGRGGLDDLRALVRVFTTGARPRQRVSDVGRARAHNGARLATMTLSLSICSR